MNVKERQKKDSELPQSLSPRHYLIAGSFMAIVGIALLALFVYFTPRLVTADILSQFYFIVLLFWGLIAAVILFGAMNGYSRVTYSHFGAAIELGGPAAFAALVVVGGIVLLPRAKPFVLTIRVHAPGNPHLSGRLIGTFGNRTEPVGLNEFGEADFKSVDHTFWANKDKPIRVLPEIQGYKNEYQTMVVNADAIDIDLVPDPPHFEFSGRIIPTPLKGQIVHVLVRGVSSPADPDEYGRFKLEVPKSENDRIRVEVCSNGKRIYDQWVTLKKEESPINTRKPDIQCGNSLSDN